MSGSDYLLENPGTRTKGGPVFQPSTESKFALLEVDNKSFQHSKVLSNDCLSYSFNSIRSEVIIPRFVIHSLENPRYFSYARRLFIMKFMSAYFMSDTVYYFLYCGYTEAA